MKKFFVFGLGVLLFASCSEENEGLTVAPEWGDVSIEFDVLNDGYKTRGSLNNAEPFDLGNVGVFCLAKSILSEGYQAGVTSMWDIKYNGDAYKQLSNSVLDINQLCRWKFNELAKVEPATTPGTGTLVWDNGEINIYPREQYFAYEFFAYYPYTSTIDVSATTKGYSIIPCINADGNDDVLYAISDEPDPADDPDGTAYSWGYFRNDENAPKPHFHFKHLMSKLNFQVKLTKETISNLRVDSIYIDSLYNIIKPRYLRYDQRQDYELRKSLLETLYWPYDKESYGTYWLRERNDESIRDQMVGSEYKYKLSTTAVSVGDGLMIPPVIRQNAKNGAYFNSEHRYILKVKVDVKDDQDAVYTYTFILTPPEANDDENGWLQGIQYQVILKIDPTKTESAARILFDGDVSVLEGWPDPIVLPDAVEVTD